MAGYPGLFCSPNKPLRNRLLKGVHRGKSSGWGVFSARSGHHYEKNRGDVQIYVTAFKDITLLPISWIKNSNAAMPHRVSTMSLLNCYAKIADLILDYW